MTSRDERVERAMGEFYDKPLTDQIISWYNRKLAQEKAPKGQCVVCKSLKFPIGLSGIGCTFERHADGRLTAVCGGRDGEQICPGYNIQQEAYVDQVTVSTEIRSTLRSMRKDLKLLRDRVLATETLSKGDEKTFREMSDQYSVLKQIEEEHKSEIERVDNEYSQIISIEDEILVPEAYFGDTTGLKLRTPMLPMISKTGGISHDEAEYPEMLMVAMCKDDIPVRVMVDEPTDDS